MKENDKISELCRSEVEKLLNDQTSYFLQESEYRKDLDEAWYEITSELDIDDVWSRITDDLDVEVAAAGKKRFLFKSAAAVIILLISLIPVNKFIEKTRYAEKLKDLKLPVNQRFSVTLAPDKMDNKTRNTFPAVTADSSENQRIAAISAPKDSVNINYDRISQLQSIKSVPVHTNLPDQFLYRLSAASLKNNGMIAYDETLSSATRGSRLFIGFATLVKNTWLLNNETYTGLKSESISSSEIVFYPDLNITLGYILNDTWGILAEGSVYSKTGQKYHDYLFGHYVSKNVTLTYSTVAILINRRFILRGILNSRSSFNLYGGGYFSVLNNANQKINSMNENLSSQYRKSDYGVRLGFDFEVIIGRNLSVGPGFFVSRGIPNIYSGNTLIPGDLRNTKNFSDNFRLVFYYRFK